jgi:DNA-binding transcriptional LysR family regulator
MEPSHLRQLAEIVDLGSLSLAAKSLNVSQPTLSRNIKSLEALIGAPVLKRGRYGVTPTRIGEALARDGRAIRDALTNAGQEVGHWKGGLEGRLRVGVGTMLAHSLMPRFLDDPRTAAWNVALRIEVERPNRLIERVWSRGLDIALVEIDPYFPKEELTQLPLFEDRRAFYAGESHPLARGGKVSAKDIGKTQQVLVGAYDEYRRGRTDMAATNDGRGQRVELTGDVAIALHLLATGKYVAMLPEFVMSHLCDSRTFVRLPYGGRMPSRMLSVWHRSDMAGHPLIKSFCQLFLGFLSTLRNDRASNASAGRDKAP